jgi:hypothetical protein
MTPQTYIVHSGNAFIGDGYSFGAYENKDKSIDLWVFPATEVTPAQRPAKEDGSQWKVTTVASVADASATVAAYVRDHAQSLMADHAIASNEERMAKAGALGKITLSLKGLLPKHGDAALDEIPADLGTVLQDDGTVIAPDGHIRTLDRQLLDDASELVQAYIDVQDGDYERADGLIRQVAILGAGGFATNAIDDMLAKSDAMDSLNKVKAAKIAANPDFAMAFDQIA